MQNDTKIVYCLVDRQQLNDPEQGSLTPVFEESADGLTTVDSSEFVNNGKIHVTRGFNRLFSGANSYTFYKVTANISNSWNPSESHDGISKYVTYYKNIEHLKYLEVAIIIDAQYPLDESVVTSELISSFYPIDGFFIRCTNERGNNVLIGPLDVVKESISEINGNYSFSYIAPNRPFGSEFSKINNLPHGTLEFDLEALPNNYFVQYYNNNFLTDLSSLPYLSSRLIDLSSTDNLIKWAAKLIRLSGAEIQLDSNLIKAWIDKIPEDISIPKEQFKKRLTRLNQIPDQLEKIDGFRPVLTNYLKSEEGRILIKQHLDANRDNLLEQFYYESLEEQVNLAKSEANKQTQNEQSNLNQLKSKKESLSKAIEELEIIKDEIESSQIASELHELEVKVKELKSEKGLILNVKELETQKKLLLQEVSDLKTSGATAQRFLSEVQHKINQSQDAHKLNLIELKMGLEALSGNVRSEKELKTKILINHDALQTIQLTSPDLSKKEIIGNITKTLRSRGRVIDFDDTAILIVSIIQNLITTLAGSPGSGKSSIVSEIAKVLGIYNCNKFVHVQVQRGWSSDRDILGFYNKLNHGYDPDRFGLYKLINGLQEIPFEDQFSIVLLDEANLSPIEHYWSGFMGACDDSTRFTTQGHQLNLPKGLRFIATVNYDRTTEPLSARFIDRGPVIYLENSKARLFDVYEEDKLEVEFNYSFKALHSLFTECEDNKLTRDEDRILTDIIEEFRFLSVNHRKIKSLVKFTSVLRNVLEQGLSESMKAFDYAVLIHILPMVSGQGRDYSKSILEFYEFLLKQGLTKSSERLKDIIEKGKFDSYSFFS